MRACVMVLLLWTSACSQILGIEDFHGGEVVDAAPNDGAPGDGHLIAQQAYVKASNTGAGDNFGFAVAVSADGNTLAVGARYEASAANGVGGSQTDNTAAQAGAVYVYSRAGTTWSQQAYIKASNSDAGDQFGVSLAISGDGNTLVVGAYHEASAATGIDGNQADNTAASAGAAYIFVRAGTTWTQQAYVKGSNTAAGDLFGIAVAISADGMTVGIGAVDEDSASTTINSGESDNTALGAGAAYIFVRSGVMWSQQAYIKASNTKAGDELGWTLALSQDGNTFAVAAVLEDGAATGIDGNQADLTAMNAGAVYVYTRAGVTWSQEAYVKASNTGAGDDFGYYLALSSDGNTLAVGALNESSAATGIDGNQADNPTTLMSGAAYLFARGSTAWSQTAYVKASNTEAGDKFGERVALSPDGTVLAVGTLYEASAATGIDGDQSDNTTMDSGAVYVFGVDGGTWHQTAYVKASNTEAGDTFGFVALSADSLVVGACAEDSAATGIDGAQTDNTAVDSGAVYVFE